MHVAIIGNGITGITAALRIRAKQPDWRISVISGESKYHYSRPALMYIFMGHMSYQETKPYEDRFWEEQRLDLVRAWVRRIDCEKRRLELHGGAHIDYDRLLIATGSQSNRFGWPGQDLPGVQGLYDLRDLSRLYENVKTVRRAVIVGGGLIGIELAEMLRSREIDISFVVREASYWNNVLPAEESAMVNRLIRHHGMELLLESELDRIEEGSDGRVCAVVTKDGHSIECQFVGLTAGVSPNIGLAKEAGLTVGRGIQVDRSLRTSNENIWAAGDCAEIVTEGEGRNLIQQVWYTGREQGDIAGDTIAGIERNHHPGIWYNSAKFLDLEYQTYGRVNLSLEDEENLFWSHENSMHAVRIVHVAGVVIGFNFMGWRARHRVCERWIAQSASVEHVLASLDEASFDPEFFEKMANQALPELQAQWRRRGAEAKA